MNVIWHYWQRKNFYPTTAAATTLFCWLLLIKFNIYTTKIIPIQSGINCIGKVIILVTSNAPNQALRQAHRQAYTQEFLMDHFQAQRVFLVAQDHSLPLTTLSKETDTLLGSFQESYRHLSLKHLMGLSWAATHCHPDSVIIKMDDDIAVDLPRLIAKATALKHSNIGGWVHSGMKVRRGSSTSKWAVTASEFPNSTYPDFVSGWVYAATQPTVQEMVAQASSQLSDPFWIDDVWLTGLVRQQLEHLRLQHWNDQYTPYLEHLQCCLKEPRHFCDFIAGPTEGNR